MKWEERGLEKKKSATATYDYNKLDFNSTQHFQSQYGDLD